MNNKDVSLRSVLCLDRLSYYCCCFEYNEKLEQKIRTFCRQEKLESAGVAVDRESESLKIACNNIIHFDGESAYVF